MRQVEYPNISLTYTLYLRMYFYSIFWVSDNPKTVWVLVNIKNALIKAIEDVKEKKKNFHLFQLLTFFWT